MKQYRIGMRRKPHFVLLFVSLFVLFLPLTLAQDQKFKPACTLPFQLIAKQRPIDGTCGIEGQASSQAITNQDLVKNNFCAKNSPNSLSPIPLVFNDFIALQAAIKKNNIHVETGLSPDRSPLQNIITLRNGTKMGEGKVVSYVARVLEAHHSDVESGESVNCKATGVLNNDIHIALVQNVNDPECKSTTAEIAPHFRPDSWDRFTTTPKALPIAGKIVRMTGQLFFDGSHVPCTFDRSGKVAKSVNPKRISTWEIHPVYAIEVCTLTTLTACRNSATRGWMALDDWAKTQRQ